MFLKSFDDPNYHPWQDAAVMTTISTAYQGLGSGVTGANSSYSPPPAATTTSALRPSSSPENHTAVCSNSYCVSDEDYVALIQDFIFPTPFEWALIGLYVAVFVVGVLGNFLVCFVVWSDPKMRSVTNLFIVNLSVADFLVLLICLPTTVLGDVTETWYLGSAMCKVVQYLQGVSVSVSVLTLSVISIERFYAICHPLRFKATSRRARIMIGFIWIVSFLILLPDAIVLDTHSVFPPELTVLLTSCKPTWHYNHQVAYQSFLILTLFILPLGLMAVAYARIAVCLWSAVIPSETSTVRHRTSTVTSSLATTVEELQVYSNSAHSERHGQVLSRRKVAKMLIAVVIMFGICYLPVHLLNILRYIQIVLTDKVAPHIALIAHWLCYFNSAINPVIYNFMSEKFQKAFRKALCCSLAKPGSFHQGSRLILWNASSRQTSNTTRLQRMTTFV